MSASAPSRSECASPVPEPGILASKKQQINVVLFEKIDHSVAEWFTSKGFNVTEIPRGMVDDELIETIKDAQMIGIRSKTKVTAKVLEASPNLVAVGCFCIGTNQVDLEAASKQGIAVFNSPFENTRSVAELMIAEIVSLSRFLGDRNRECHNGTWGKTSVNCHEIRGKKLGLVGYGHIGSQLSVMAEAMGMDVYFYDIVRKMPLGNSTRLDSLEELLSTVDFVSLHVPATPETNMMIKAEQLALMQAGSYLLNASRGTVVDLDALADAIKSGHIRGAAIDVYPAEPRSNCTDWDSPLQGLPNVILTPHIGGSTEEAQVNIGRDVQFKLYKYLTTGRTVGSVNVPEVNVHFSSSSIHRITNYHENVPGVMKGINSLLADFNIVAETLVTQKNIGYIVIDVESEGHALSDLLDQLPHNIRTRTCW